MSRTRPAARSNMVEVGFFARAVAMSCRMPCVSIGNFAVGRTNLVEGRGGTGERSTERVEKHERVRVRQFLIFKN